MVEKIQLEPDEQILIQVRKHWFILAIQFFGIIIAGIFPLLLYSFILLTIQLPFDATKYINVSVALYTVWLLFIWMALFNIWTNYYLDVWTVTNKRLIVADQRGFFSRSTASFRLERLQDIIVSVHGLIATLLDFGELEIQTAGEERNFKARGLPKPGELKGLILGATDTIMAQGPVRDNHNNV